jgi:hypothetical protein
VLCSLHQVNFARGYAFDDAAMTAVYGPSSREMPGDEDDGAQITAAGARGVAAHCAGSCP